MSTVSAALVRIRSAARRPAAASSAAAAAAASLATIDLPEGHWHAEDPRLGGAPATAASLAELPAPRRPVALAGPADRDVRTASRPAGTVAGTVAVALAEAPPVALDLRSASLDLRTATARRAARPPRQRSAPRGAAAATAAVPAPAPAAAAPAHVWAESSTWIG